MNKILEIETVLYSKQKQYHSRTKTTKQSFLLFFTFWQKKHNARKWLHENKDKMVFLK